MVGIPCGAAACWLAYVRVQTGEIVPGSASALRVLWGVADQAVITDAARLSEGLRDLWTELVAFVAYVPSESAYGGVALTAVLCGLAGLGGWGLARGEPEARRRAGGLMLGVVLGTTIWAAFYLLHHGGFRFWYFAYLSLPVFLVLVPLVVLGLERIAPLTGRAWIVAAVTFACAELRAPATIYAPQEYDKYRSALLLDELLEGLPPGTRIGSFNTGIYDYFSETDVLNLDGVVNAESRRAIERGELPAYLAERRVTYLIDGDLGQEEGIELLDRDPRVRLERVLDLRTLYPPYRGRYARRTYLWRVVPVEAPRPSESPGP